ncbi:Protein K03B4.1 [Aphelenchoides avenae]|nr:Protein K03B4.1 [Aphelenchus avenae]
MQHLAARFVRVASLPNVAAVPHVVDPYLDMRPRFERLDELEANIRARNLSFDVGKIAEGYAKWWASFIDTERCERDSSEYKISRSKMLDNSAGLLEALKLPNELHIFDFPDDAPSTSRHTGDIPRWSAELDPQFALQLELGKHMARLFPAAIRCSSPHMVRPAMVEACNYRPSQYVKITEDDGETQICLTGK